MVISWNSIFHWMVISYTIKAYCLEKRNQQSAWSLNKVCFEIGNQESMWGINWIENSCIIYSDSLLMDSEPGLLFQTKIVFRTSHVSQSMAGNNFRTWRYSCEPRREFRTCSYSEPRVNITNRWWFIPNLHIYLDSEPDTSPSQNLTFAKINFATSFLNPKNSIFFYSFVSYPFLWSKTL